MRRGRIYFLVSIHQILANIFNLIFVVVVISFTNTPFKSFTRVCLPTLTVISFFFIFKKSEKVLLKGRLTSNTIMSYIMHPILSIKLKRNDQSITFCENTGQKHQFFTETYKIMNV